MKEKSGQQHIAITGARAHNLKNVSVRIPKNKLVVITGLSGSGKSSLAFDTLYAEAERRFVESLSSYARQFLGVKEKPAIESIEGLSPAISIDQKSITRNPRSTVGTITEIYDYLRILFARIGSPHCPRCARPVGRQTVDQIVDAITRLAKREEILIVAPVVSGKKGEHRGIIEELQRAGFLRVRIDGALKLIDDALASALDKKKKHSVEAVVDRFVLGRDVERSRIRDSVETALKAGKGIVIISQSGSDALFSEEFACIPCGVNLAAIEPRTFSFNSPYGACPVCTGLGSTLEVDPALIFPNPRLSVAEGAIRPWAHASHRVGRQSWYWWMLDDLAARHKFSLETPIGALPKSVVDLILYGERGGAGAVRVPIESVEAAEEGGEEVVREEGEEGDAKPGTFEGVIPNLMRRWKETDSEFTRAEIEKYMIIKTCPECGGKRLRREALAVKIGDENIASVADRTVAAAERFFRTFRPKSANEARIAEPLVKEITKRLEFLRDVGLEYLTLSRESTTLSGGEAQRIQLATQIGSRLTGITYILDEPSIGLHARDHARLIETLKHLRDLGNTVIVVEHDAETMRSADWVIELGPGAGKHGGEIVFEGTPRELARARTLTGEYLSGRKRVDIKNEKRKAKSEKRERAAEQHLVIRGATEHNLKNVDVALPLGKFIVVSGVSGSGKSTLINDILAKALLAKFYGAHLVPGAHGAITGTEHLDKVVVVDQSPIGRTPRSNPATYTGAFGFIRSAFAGTLEARSRGYGPGRFSFNVKGGRCEACEGQGVKKIEMYFLPDVYVECEECGGQRYNREALEIKYREKTIAEVLDMSIDEARKFFDALPPIRTKLDTLHEVGLGYIKLGQSAPTLSGGEAQRVKLATELSRRDTGRTLYILDEPTTGLHFDDIAKLLGVLAELVRRGNTVLVIEHNLDVLRNADHLIDLGPDGGERGGVVVAEGAPADVAKVRTSYTGQWLARML